MRKLHQELIKLLLSICQLPTPAEIYSEAVHDTIDDKQPILTTRKLFCEGIEQLKLMFTVQSPSVCDILLRGVGIDTEPFSDLGNSFWPESPFRIDVGDFTFRASHVLWQLRHDGYCVRELSLPATELPIDLTNAHALETAVEGVSNLPERIPNSNW